MEQPSLVKIFKLLERMEKEGILSSWAIGGSIGVMFYTEPYCLVTDQMEQNSLTK